MVKHRPEARSSHWNVKMDILWKSMGKAKRKMKSSSVATDRVIYEYKRDTFQEANRQSRRKFSKRKQERLRKGGNNAVVEAIWTDDRRRRQREREKAARDDSLNPGDFTEFMGSHHDQNQQMIELENFLVH